MTTGKLIILRGLRKMLHDGTYIQGSKNNPGTERTVIEMEHAMVRRGLRAGLTVIDDNTNLPNRSVKALVEIAEPLGAEWQIVDFTDVPVETCVERNLRRAERVPDGVISDLYQKFVKGKSYPLPFEYTPKPELAVEKYVPNDQKPIAVIVDIDGTVALMDGKRTPHEYDKVSLDSPNWPVINLVKMMRTVGHEILFTSGRKDSCRDDTVQWLKDYVFFDGGFRLVMRKHEDNRPDNVVKLEIFNQLYRDEFNVKLVLDDRDQVVRMWRSLGLTCLQVAEGNF
jgi:predicted kinase